MKRDRSSSSEGVWLQNNPSMTLDLGYVIKGIQKPWNWFEAAQIIEPQVNKGKGKFYLSSLKKYRNLKNEYSVINISSKKIYAYMFSLKNAINAIQGGINSSFTQTLPKSDIILITKPDKHHVIQKVGKPIFFMNINAQIK